MHIKSSPGGRSRWSQERVYAFEDSLLFGVLSTILPSVTTRIRSARFVMFVSWDVKMTVESVSKRLFMDNSADTESRAEVGSSTRMTSDF